jgi:hypothetical protein
VRAAAREHQIANELSLFVGTEHLQPFVEKHLQKTYTGIKQRLVLLRSNGSAQRHISNARDARVRLGLKSDETLLEWCARSDVGRDCILNGNDRRVQ